MTIDLSAIGAAPAIGERGPGAHDRFASRIGASLTPNQDERQRTAPYTWALVDAFERRADRLAIIADVAREHSTRGQTGLALGAALDVLANERSLVEIARLLAEGAP